MNDSRTLASPSEVAYWKRVAAADREAWKAGRALPRAERRALAAVAWHSRGRVKAASWAAQEPWAAVVARARADRARLDQLAGLTATATATADAEADA